MENTNRKYLWKILTIIPIVVDENTNEYGNDGKYLWKIFMENIYGKYLWKILIENIMENFYGKYLWKILIENTYGKYLRSQIVSIVVDEHPDEDGNNGKDNAEQGHASEFVHKLDPKEDDGAHGYQQQCSIHLK